MARINIGKKVEERILKNFSKDKVRDEPFLLRFMQLVMEDTVSGSEGVTD